MSCDHKKHVRLVEVTLCKKPDGTFTKYYRYRCSCGHITWVEAPPKVVDLNGYYERK